MQSFTVKDVPKDAHECVSLNRVPFQNDENISPHPTATDWLFASLHSPLPGRGRGGSSVQCQSKAIVVNNALRLSA